MASIKELRDQLSVDDIKGILARFGVFPYAETDATLIYPTVCHNLTDGSPKLYYYKEHKIFKCYTECNSVFDIFTLLMKMKKLRGEEIGLYEAILMTGVNQEEQTTSQEILHDLAYLEAMKKTIIEDENIYETKLRILDRSIIQNFPFNEVGLSSWMNEGISKLALDRFSIRYDSTVNAIVIPNFDHDGNLIGIRGRFMGENVRAKYMPLKVNDEILSHPTGKFLYGYYENKNVIKKKGIVVIFEGEKSVLKMESLYPESNLSLATAGKKITLDHLDALLKLGLREVVLAYDKDYSTSEERKEKLEEYKKITAILGSYFEVSIIIDYDNLLDYKDSPIDKGKEVFEKLMSERIKR